MQQRTSDKSRWDDFWTRDRDLSEIYDNDDRICTETLSRMNIEGLLVLEVGAATARDSISFSKHGATSIALDYSHEALRLASEAAGRRDADILLVCADAEALPFRNDCIDMVFHQGFLEHFRNPEPLISENVRVLRMGGTILVDVPQTFHVYTPFKKLLIACNKWLAGWETQYTTGQIAAILCRHGMVTTGVYGRFFSPSLAYRIFRELMMKLGVRLPLRPVLFPPVHRLRSTVRKAIEGSALGPSLGCIVGVFARKQDCAP